jgi:hypothetical protein
MTAYGEERLARLIAALPRAPEAWVRAAQELPFTQLDDIVARAEADAQFRALLVANLEAALAQAGYEPNASLVDALRARLGSS